ncbi:hypothetical protein MLD38_025238 [Melastoma candidum]|uniref:Uncharacterized protein n=1 Tax=Melastoma candidum TaxID=119954 RepID=A0ACB9NXU2_9MYRT|nr:hypothetical protein MLD38_025238 [Melastoma candidum]
MGVVGSGLHLGVSGDEGRGGMGSIVAEVLPCAFVSLIPPPWSRFFCLPVCFRANLRRGCTILSDTRQLLLLADWMLSLAIESPTPICSSGSACGMLCRLHLGKDHFVHTKP